MYFLDRLWAYPFFFFCRNKSKTVETKETKEEPTGPKSPNEEKLKSPRTTNRTLKREDAIRETVPKPREMKDKHKEKVKKEEEVKDKAKKRKEKELEKREERKLKVEVEPKQLLEVVAEPKKKKKFTSTKKSDKGASCDLSELPSKSPEVKKSRVTSRANSDEKHRGATAKKSKSSIAGSDKKSVNEEKEEKKATTSKVSKSDLTPSTEKEIKSGGQVVSPSDIPKGSKLARKDTPRPGMYVFDPFLILRTVH